jgi:hypothetical protein
MDTVQMVILCRASWHDGVDTAKVVDYTDDWVSTKVVKIIQSIRKRSML